MAKVCPVSRQTCNNWLVDAALALAGLVATVSGIYFLFFPQGGYRGGRNPAYGVTVLFSRHTWDALHTWSGIAMVAAAVVHLAIHWRWVLSMARRAARWLASGERVLSRGGWVNLGLNAVVAASFVVTAASGIYLFFVPGGRWAADPHLLLSRATWDLAHTWAGVLFIAAAAVHVVYHRKWIAKVSPRAWRSLLAGTKPAVRPADRAASEA